MKHFILTFREDITVSYGFDNEIFLQNDSLNLNINKPSPGIKAFIEKLSGNGDTEDNMADMVAELDGLNGVTRFYYYLERFSRLSIICRTLLEGNNPFATVEPVSFYFKNKYDGDIKDKKFILSRFALIRMEKNRFILESPLSLCRIILHDKRTVEIIHLLNDAKSSDDMAGKLGCPDIISPFLSILLNNDFILPAEEDGSSPEEKNEVLRQWEFHDLLFHSRHRIGRHNYPNGATYSFLNKIDPRPPFKDTMTEKGIPLFKPHMDKLLAEDFPFTLVVEERKSVRSYGDKPVTLEQIGEFLYRSYRIKELRDSADGGDMYQVTIRPCAGGGACYELELYLVVNKCEGLSSGIYHYHALNHEVHFLKERNEPVELLLKRAHVSAVKLCFPEVLFVITARFQRVSWKYSGMAYATILKNVGALYQNMYLVATAMELSPCALGNGDADLFCHAVDLDYLVESPVGEFMIGSKRI